MQDAIKKKRNKKNIFYGAIAVFMLGFLLSQVFSINYNPVVTEIALERSLYDSAAVTVFVVRDEYVIESNQSGTLVPLVEDGKRVASGDTVAVTFTDSASAKRFSEIAELEEKISYYESLNHKMGIQTTDIEPFNEKINEMCENLILCANTGEIEKYGEFENAVRDAVTGKQLATGAQIDVTEKLAALKSQLAALKSASNTYGSVTASHPGYYISRVDGYEGAISYKDVLQTDAATIDNLLTGAGKETTASNQMGKLVDGFNWYMLCTVDYENASKLKIGSGVRVRFPFGAVEEITAKVCKIESAGDGRSTLVLSCNLMNTAVAGLRIEKAELIFNEYSGYEISNKAIREVDGEKGVYVLTGNIVKFKKINIIYSDADYTVVNNPENKASYLRLYDEVIVEGTDLYDGKVFG